MLWLIPGTAILLLKFTQLADKQKFAVFWQRPDLVIDEFLEFIDRSAHCVETFGNLVICNGLAPSGFKRGKFDCLTTGNVIKRYVEEEMLKGVERFEIK